jgi:hypothetical protein
LGLDQEGSPKGGDGEGKGNEVEYAEENTIKIQYEDVDGDGVPDTKCINADSDDEGMTYKT